MVRTMLDETEFAVDFSIPEPTLSTPGQSTTPPNPLAHFSPLDQERMKIRKLGAAVVRLWAETFKGTQIFDIVKAMGSSLEIYAELLEKVNEEMIGGAGGGAPGNGVGVGYMQQQQQAPQMGNGIGGS